VGDEHPAYAAAGAWLSLPFLLASGIAFGSSQLKTCLEL